MRELQCTRFAVLITSSSHARAPLLTSAVIEFGVCVCCLPRRAFPVLFFHSGFNKIPTFVAINHLFGPTYPGHYDDSEGVYYLNYPVS